MYRVQAYVLKRNNTYYFYKYHNYSIFIKKISITINGRNMGSY